MGLPALLAVSASATDGLHARSAGPPKLPGPLSQFQARININININIKINININIKAARNPPHVIPPRKDEAPAFQDGDKQEFLGNFELNEERT